MKLYYIRGIRHNAIVFALNKEEAIRLAIEASNSDKPDPQILYGYVGDWESPEAYELKLPKNYKVVNLKE